MSDQILNFTSLRPPELLSKKHYLFRYIRDSRPPNVAIFRESLLRTNGYFPKVLIARTFFQNWQWPVPNKRKSLSIPNPFFFSQQHYYYFNFDNLVRILRQTVKAPIYDSSESIDDGAKLSELNTKLRSEVWWIKSDFSTQISVTAAHMLTHSLWSTLYATSVLSSTQNMETNYILDTIRSMHILLLLKYLAAEKQHEYWPYQFDFDDFEVLINEDIF